MLVLVFFFFNDTATTEIYTLSLHDALPISILGHRHSQRRGGLLDGHHPRGRDARLLHELRPRQALLPQWAALRHRDRKSTRLNSSHANISYAVFCLKKKKKHTNSNTHKIIQ